MMIVLRMITRPTTIAACDPSARVRLGLISAVIDWREVSDLEAAELLCARIELTAHNLWFRCAHLSGDTLVVIAVAVALPWAG
jgi:hypothetical protein